MTAQKMLDRDVWICLTLCKVVFYAGVEYPEAANNEALNTKPNFENMNAW